jgi:hypothetical protein
MTGTLPVVERRSLVALQIAWPAMVLAAVLLLPFLNTPFTIDDPLYLREAQHALVEPLHPQAFSMVWSTDLELRAGQILPGGVSVPYLLLPTALAGCAEWAGHLTQLLLLLAALYATALAALRLGLDRMQTRFVVILTATCPAVLGIAGTVMPDIPAMLFVVLGMERLIAWREDRHWSQATGATLWLTLAALTRAHTIVALPAAFVFLLDGIRAEEIRSSFRSFRARFLPLVLTPLAVLVVSELTGDPESAGDNIFTWVMDDPGAAHLIVQNASAFLAHLMIVVPLTIPWLAQRYRQIPSALMLAFLAAGCAASVRLGWVAFAGAATLIALTDILMDALRRRDRVQLALWLWLFLAVPVILYVHLPSKYLLPSVPAAAMLVVRRLRDSGPAAARRLIPVLSTAWAILGVLILLGVRDLAETQRRAVTELILPHTQAFERVWFSGHWGFQWYAESAGATPVTLQPPFPQPGDIIVVSYIDHPRFARDWTERTVLQHVTYPNRFGRVMDFEARSGFFSSPSGFLPWVPGSGRANTFEVWRVK